MYVDNISMTLLCWTVHAREWTETIQTKLTLVVDGAQLFTTPTVQCLVLTESYSYTPTISRIIAQYPIALFFFHSMVCTTETVVPFYDHFIKLAGKH